MEEAEILEPYELHYADLLRLSSNDASSSSPEELDKVGSMIRTIMETLGPSGPGLLAITGVPNASKLRSRLLPLARKLALLNHETRKRILKEYNLGSDVPLKNPDRSVSSFAMQLKYTKAPELTKSKPNSGSDCQLHSEENPLIVDMEFKNLGGTFRELGFCMMDLGIRLAQICDMSIGGNELEQSLLESSAAKGRLIHYHSSLDGILLKEVERSRATGKRQANIKKDLGQSSLNGQKTVEGSESNLIAPDANSCGIHSSSWQPWHYDYGIFTVLTAPFFLLPWYSGTNQVGGPFPASCYDECPSPMGHTSLQIYDPNKRSVLMVKAPPESFIIQVGESADIISKGKLRSTLHSVYRPAKFENLSRETFVVFLQPAWTKTFSTSDYPYANSIFNGFNGQCSVASDDEHQIEQEDCKMSHEILKIVPPLSSRLKDGMTFAEFSRETTKQYYSGSGLQSNR